MVYYCSQGVPGGGHCQVGMQVVDTLFSYYSLLICLAQGRRRELGCRGFAKVCGCSEDSLPGRQPNHRPLWRYIRSEPRIPGERRKFNSVKHTQTDSIRSGRRRRGDHPRIAWECSLRCSSLSLHTLIPMRACVLMARIVMVRSCVRPKPLPRASLC